jgi:hypothetical protein
MCGFRILALLSFLPAALLAQRVERGGYIMLQGPVEVTHETYGFDGTTLSDTVDFPARGIRMESIARYDGEYSPVSYVLDLFSGSDDVPVQQVVVSFDDTAAVWSTHTELGDSTGVTRLERPYAFMQNLVFAQLAVVLLRYDHARGGTQRLNVWMPEQAASLNLEITFTSTTSGNVQIAGTAMNVEVDDDGWLRSAAVPAQHITVESSAHDLP